MRPFESDIETPLKSIGKEIALPNRAKIRRSDEPKTNRAFCRGGQNKPYSLVLSGVLKSKRESKSLKLKSIIFIDGIEIQSEIEIVKTEIYRFYIGIKSKRKSKSATMESIFLRRGIKLKSPHESQSKYNRPNHRFVMESKISDNGIYNFHNGIM